MIKYYFLHYFNGSAGYTYNLGVNKDKAMKEAQRRWLALADKDKKKYRTKGKFELCYGNKLNDMDEDYQDFADDDSMWYDSYDIVVDLTQEENE